MDKYSSLYIKYYLDENEEMIFDDLYHYIIDYNNDNKNKEPIPLILILHENDNHYQILYFHYNIKENIEIIKEDKTKQKLNNIKKNIIKKNHLQ